MTPDLAVELWPAYVRLVATSWLVIVGVGELATLAEALQDAMGELARAADGELDGGGASDRGEHD